MTWTLTAAGVVATAVAMILVAAAAVFGSLLQWLFNTWSGSSAPVDLEIGTAIRTVWEEWTILTLAGPVLLAAAWWRVRRSPGAPSLAVWLSVTATGLVGLIALAGLVLIVVG